MLWVRLPDFGNGFSANGMHNAGCEVGQGFQNMSESHDLGAGNFKLGTEQVQIAVQKDIDIQGPV